MVLSRKVFTVAILGVVAACGGEGSPPVDTTDALADTQVNGELPVASDDPSPDSQSQVAQADPSQESRSSGEDPLNSSGVESADAEVDPEPTVGILASGFTVHNDFRDRPTASVGARLVNNTGRDLVGVRITYSIQDVDGSEVGSGFEDFATLPSEGTTLSSAPMFFKPGSGGPYVLEVASNPGRTLSNPRSVELDIAGLIISQNLDNWGVSGSVTNSSGEPVVASVRCLLLGDPGATDILGGLSADQIGIAPGETQGWNLLFLASLYSAGVANAECQALVSSV